MAGNPIVTQFNKIMLLNGIANQIGYYGVQNGNETLMDQMDLKCGAIPEGEFSQVIDPESPEQFLSLYSKIAENRFAVAVTELLNMNPSYITPVKGFMNKVGQDMDLPEVADIQQAYKVYDAFVLDGMPGEETKEVTSSTPSSITWQKLTDTHQASWEKADGDLAVYYSLLQSFIEGLFVKSGYTLQIDNQLFFTLGKNDEE